MNKGGDQNRSVRNTKKKLRDELLRLMQTKSVNEITAKELAELADVNRGTFYFHYSDIYDLLHSIEDDFFAQLEQMLNAVPPPEGSALDYLTTIFTFIGQNPELCRVMLGPNGDMQFVSRVKRLVERRCSFFWRCMGPDAKPVGDALYSAFIVDGCIGLVTTWLEDGLRESPEEISQMVARIVLNSAAPCLGRES